MNYNVRKTLETIKEEINKKYGFHGEIPRINYGPCGVFAKIFYDKWNELFHDKCNICFILTFDRDECDHITIRLSSGELYDGGIGVHTENNYLGEFLVEDMLTYDEELLNKWSYGLDRTYPRFCPDFNREFVESVIHSNLENLFKLIGPK